MICWEYKGKTSLVSKMFFKHWASTGESTNQTPVHLNSIKLQIYYVTPNLTVDSVTLFRLPYEVYGHQIYMMPKTSTVSTVS